MNERNRLDFEVECIQSNTESEIITQVHNIFKDNTQGLIINLASFAHISITIWDVLAMIDISNIEVHFSNIYKREDFN